MIQITDMIFKEFNFVPDRVEPRQAVALAYTSESGHFQHGVWECGPGEMDLDFLWDETVFVIDGRAELENLENGERLTLITGALHSFRRGSRWRWRIPWKFKKVFTIVD